MKAILTILFLYTAILSAQNNLLKPLGQSGPENEILQIKRAVKNFRGFKSIKPYDAGLAGINGVIDTLSWAAHASYNVNFGFFGQDVMVQWFEAPTDMSIKAVSFTCTDDENSAVSVKLVSFRWDKDQIQATQNIGATHWGYYEATGNGYNDISPFEDDLETTGDWVEAGQTAQDSLWGSPFGSSLWGTEAVEATAINGQWTWVEMDQLGFTPQVVTGEIFGVAIKNEGTVLDSGRTGLAASNMLGITGFKFYRNGRLAPGEDYGWWTRLYSWDITVAVELSGCRAPVFGEVTYLSTTLSQEPRRVEAKYQNVNPSGGSLPQDTVSLNYWDSNSDHWTSVIMDSISPGTFEAYIPGYPPGTEVRYFCRTEYKNPPCGNAESQQVSYYIFQPSSRRLVFYDDTNFGIGTVNAFWLDGLPPDATWNWSVDFWEARFGPLSLELLENYEQVYHIMGDGPYNSPADIGLVYKSWMDQAEEDTPRNLFLSGQDYGYISVYKDTTFSPGSFEYDYLGIETLGPQDVSYILNGNSTDPYFVDFVPGDTLTGWMAQLYSENDSSRLAYNPSGPLGTANWIDNMTVSSGVPVLTDPNNNGAAVAVRNEGSNWKTTFWALDPLGLDMISKTDSSRNQWVNSIQNPAVAVFSWFGDVKDPVNSIDDESNLAKNFKLSQNYPNPFNPSTVINYELQKTNDVKLIVYDVLGRKVKTLVNKTQPAGEYKVTFNAANLASGVYYYKLKAGDKFEITRKMLLLR